MSQLNLLNLIYDIRTPLLNSYFSIFPFFAGEYFYILIIAIGYWSRKRPKLFLELGFWISFSTLINSLLKNLFKIPRPPIELHLIKVHDFFGFPSGDVQVSTIFWGILCINFPYKWIKFTSFFFIFNIMLSRIYLGVHNIYDVIGGLIIGISLVYISQTEKFKLIFSSWLKGKVSSYFILISLCIFLYFLGGINKIPAFFLIALGVVLGLGIVFLNKTNFENFSKFPSKFLYVTINIFSIILLILFLKLTHIENLNPVIEIIYYIIKYMTLTYMIYRWLPLIHDKIYNFFTLKSLKF